MAFSGVLIFRRYFYRENYFDADLTPFKKAQSKIKAAHKVYLADGSFYCMLGNGQIALVVHIEYFVRKAVSLIDTLDTHFV